MSARESTLLREIRAALNEARTTPCCAGSLGSRRCRVVRNSVGFATEPRKITFGLGKGSPDLVGVIRGGKCFTVEVKRPGESLRPDQRLWIRAARAWGVAAFVCSSVEDAMAALDDAESGHLGWGDE